MSLRIESTSKNKYLQCSKKDFNWGLFTILLLLLYTSLLLLSSVIDYNLIAKVIDTITNLIWLAYYKLVPSSVNNLAWIVHHQFHSCSFNKILLDKRNSIIDVSIICCYWKLNNIYSTKLTYSVKQ